MRSPSGSCTVVAAKSMPSSSLKVMGLAVNSPVIASNVYVCRVSNFVVTNSLPFTVSASTAKDFGSKQTLMSFAPPPTGTSDPLLSTVGHRLAKPVPLIWLYVNWLNCSAVMAFAGKEVATPNSSPKAAPIDNHGAAQESCRFSSASGSTVTAGDDRKPTGAEAGATLVRPKGD